MREGLRLSGGAEKAKQSQHLASDLSARAPHTAHPSGLLQTRPAARQLVSKQARPRSSPILPCSPCSLIASRTSTSSIPQPTLHPSTPYTPPAPLRTLQNTPHASHTTQTTDGTDDTHQAQSLAPTECLPGRRRSAPGPAARVRRVRLCLPKQPTRTIHALLRLHRRSCSIGCGTCVRCVARGCVLLRELPEVSWRKVMAVVDI